MLPHSAPGTPRARAKFHMAACYAPSGRPESDRQTCTLCRPLGVVIGLWRKRSDHRYRAWPANSERNCDPSTRFPRPGTGQLSGWLSEIVTVRLCLLCETIPRMLRPVPRVAFHRRPGTRAASTLGIVVARQRGDAVPARANRPQRHGAMIAPNGWLSRGIHWMSANLLRNKRGDWGTIIRVMVERQRLSCSHRVHHAGGVCPTPKAEDVFRPAAIADPTNAGRQPPASLPVESRRVREMTRHHARRVMFERCRLRARKRRRRRDHQNVEPDRRRTLQRQHERQGGILDSQAAMQKFVRLQIRTGQIAMRVVVLREESRRARHNAAQSALKTMQPTSPLGGEFSDAIYIARSNRPDASSSQTAVSPSSRQLLGRPSMMRWR